jgi:hypothetical protein
MTMTQPLNAWQPIATAPRDWITELPLDMSTVDRPGQTVTIRNGPTILVRGWVGDDQPQGAIACWAQQEGFGHGGGQEPHWWDLVYEVPLDWNPTEWRHLTEAEKAQLNQQHGEEQPGEGGSPPLPEADEQQAEAHRQAFAWTFRANGPSLGKWAERWGRILWQSGMPEGTDPNGKISTDLGDGWTMDRDLALDWELNRPSYMRLAASLIRQMAKDAGREIKGNPI